MGNRNVFVYSLLIIGVVFLVKCTGNPFWDDDIDSSDKLTVTGNVEMNDGSVPEDIYVWLEGLNVSASTNSSGAFTLDLPAPQLQPGGGLTGSLKLYFYVGNYEYKTAVLYVTKGYLEYGQGDLDDEGYVKKQIILEKLLDIETTVIPASVQQFDSLAFIQIILTVRNLATTVYIETIQGSTGTLIGYMFKKTDGPLTEAILNPSSRDPVMNLIIRETTFTGGARAFDLGLIAEPAQYEVFPYIRVIQAGLPEALITSIDENAHQYHTGYLNIPYRQDTGTLTCVPISN